MAWPNTPLTTYIAGTTPAVKAADLMSLQSGINGIINATYSLRAVVVDGTGGAVVAPVPGTLKAQATGSSAGVPGTAVAWGLFYKESAVFGFARVNELGQVIAGFNAKTEPGALGGGDHPVAGSYFLRFHGAPTNIARCTAAATARFAGAPRFIEVNNVSLDGADTLVQVNIWNSAGVLTDSWFDVHIFGG